MGEGVEVIRPKSTMSRVDSPGQICPSLRFVFVHGP